MREWLEKLRDGEASFAEFAAGTANDWRLLSFWLLRRWSLPPAVSEEDVQQEMLLECWRSVPLWSPDGGQPLKKWVVYRSVASAKEWLHKQRNSYKRRGSKASRFPLAFSALTEREVDLIDYWAFRAPTQETNLFRREVLSATLGRCRSDRDHYVVVAVIEAMGDIEGAVEWLYSDVNIRRRCRFGSRADARRAIWRTASKVANV
jgi:DNA-directed RNA polymerase specialized sigma24 family protein